MHSSIHSRLYSFLINIRTATFHPILNANSLNSWLCERFTCGCKIMKFWSIVASLAYRLGRNFCIFTPICFTFSWRQRTETETYRNIRCSESNQNPKVCQLNWQRKATIVWQCWSTQKNGALHPHQTLYGRETHCRKPSLPPTACLGNTEWRCSAHCLGSKSDTGTPSVLKLPVELDYGICYI